MDELISKQAAVDLVRDVCDAIISCCGSHYDEETDDEVYDDIRENDAILKCNKEIRIALKNIPSAQPEIIRCKDCRFSDSDATCCLVCCRGGQGLKFAHVRADNFCSYAERRTDE